MVDKILVAAVVADILFVFTGALELALSLVLPTIMNKAPTTGTEAVQNLVFQRLPLQAGAVNGGFILLAFLVTLPGLLMRTSRGWLKVAGYFVTFCGLFTMCVGVFLWIMTLKLGGQFLDVYMDLDPEVQGLIQTTFECCGYVDSVTPAFVTNPTCPSPAAAALLRGCQTSIANFANTLLDNIFTAVFGAVGIDAVFILTLACLAKDRREREWYRRIDQKKASW